MVLPDRHRLVLYAELAALGVFAAISMVALVMLPVIGIEGGLALAFGTPAVRQDVGGLLGSLLIQGVAGTLVPAAIGAGLWYTERAPDGDDPRMWLASVGVQLAFAAGVVVLVVAGVLGPPVGWLIGLALLALPVNVGRDLLAVERRTRMLDALGRPAA